MTHRSTAGPIHRVAVCAMLWLAMMCGSGAALAQGLTITSGPNFGTVAIGEVQIALTATGGSGAYTWNLVSGTLPTGLRIRTDVPSFFPAGTAAGLIGIATTPGTYNFTISVTSAGTTVNSACTLKVTALTPKDQFALPNGFIGVSYNYTMTALNAAGPVTWTANTALPAGLTFANGVISGIPTAAGTTTVNYTLSDGTSSIGRSFQIAVSAIHFVTAGVLSNATQGAAYSSSVAAIGGTGSFTYALTGGSLPTGLSFSSSGAISGTVTGGPGRSGFFVTATDSVSVSYTKVFSIDVIGVPPLLPSINLGNLAYKAATVGFGYSRLVNVVNGGTAPFTWTASGLPPGIDIRTYDLSSRTDLTPDDIEVFGTPAAAGDFPAQFTVTDATGAKATAAFTFSVSVLGVDGNDLPPNGTIGAPYSKQLRVLGGTGPYTVTQTNLPNAPLANGLSLNSTTLLLSGTPLENGTFFPIYEFVDSASHVVDVPTSLNIGGGTSTVNINQSLNLGTSTVNSSYSFQLSACCTAQQAFTWSVVGGSLPSGLNLSSAGLLSGSPNTIGTYTFLVQATDNFNSGNFGRREFQLVVTPLNYNNCCTLPFGNLGTFYSLNLTSAITGATGGVNTILQAGNFLPPGLTLTSGGLLSGTPTATGLVLFNVIFTDASAHTLVRTFILAIYSAGQLPPPGPTFGTNMGTFSIGEIQFALNATGGNGIYAWSFVSGTLPPGLALRTDVPAFFPAGTTAGLIGVATTPGTYTFSLSVTSNGVTTTPAFTMKITAFTVRDIFNLPDAFAGSPYSYTFAPLSNAGAVTYTLTGTIAPGLTLSSSGVLSGTPTAPGFYNVPYSVNDGSETIFRSFGLTVSAVQISTPGLLPNGTRNGGYNVTLTASGGTPPYSFTSGGLPAGLSLNSLTGVISGVISGNQGRFNFNATVTDHNSISYTKEMMIDVLNPPVTTGYLQPYGNFDNCSLGVGCSLGIAVLNGGTAPFSWNVTGLPTGMSFRTGSGTTSNYIWPGDLELWGTPTTLGTFNVRVTVTDANGLTTSETYPLRVSALLVDGNDTLPPGTRGVAYSKTLRVIGGAGPYTVAQQPNSQMPAGLTLAGFVVAGTPTENGFFNGEFVFTDSAGPTHNTLQITSYFNINPTSNVNINNGSNLGSTVVNFFYSNQLSACCVTAYTWSFTGGTLPPGITLAAGGLLSGTPTVSGTYTFTAQAADASNPSNIGVRVFTLNVTPLNYNNCCTLPFGNVGSLYSQSLPLTGATGAATFTLAPSNFLPPGLSLNSSTGLLSGTPTEIGQFNFAVVASDSAGHTILRNFTVFIFAAGGVPPVVITSSPNLTWMAGARDFGLGATGGNGTFTWSLVSGTLPPGIAIRTDFPGFFNSNTAGDLSGVATTPGTYNFTLMASSGGQSATQAFTVKVTALSIKDPGIPDAYVGAPYSYTFNALNNAGPVAWSATGVPAGMNFSSAGVLSGIPTASGFVTVQATLNDGVDIVGGIFNINLSIFDIQITSPSPLPSPTQFQPYTTNLTANGGTPPYTFTAGGLPAGLTLSALNATTAVISGTTTQGAGKFNFNLTVTDSHSVSRSQAASITVIGAPVRLPWINVSNMDDCTAYTPCSRTLFANSGGTPPFSWTATGLPPGMSIRSGMSSTSNFVAPGDGEIWGTPSTPGGTFTVNATVTDALGAKATATFPLVVSQLWAWGTPDSLVGGTRGTPYSSKMRIIGGSGSGYTANLFAGFLPAGLTLNGLTVSGTPAENGGFGPVFVFHDSLGHTLQRTEGFSIGGGTSTININQGFANFFPATVNVSFSSQLSASGVPSFAWTLVSGTLPPGITLTSGGLLSGVPTTPGTYIFSVSAADSTNPSNFGVRQLEIIVSPLNLSVSTALPDGNVGTLYSQTLTVTGATGSVTWTLLPFNYLPPGITLSSAGVLSGTPTTVGQYNFSIIATDSASNVLTRGFNVSIFGAGATAPLGLNFGPFINTSVGSQNFQLTASGGTPPYHFSQAPGSTIITGMRVIDGPPLPTFFPANVTGGYVGVLTNTGVFTTTLRVTDNLGTTFDRPVNLSVYNHVPQAANPLPHAALGTLYSYNFNGIGGSGSFSWSAANLPSGLSMSSAGVLSGTPTAAGTFNPSINITDLSNNVTLGYGYTLVVDPFAITTGGVLPQGTIGTPYSQTLQAPNCGSGCNWSFVSGSLPSGLSLNISTGVISGTPTFFFSGGFTIQASGSNGTAQKVFGIFVPFNTIQPLFINMGATIGTSVQIGTTSVFLTVQGGTPPYTWSVAAGSLPPGIRMITSPELVGFNLTPGATYLQGRPLQAGTFAFTLQVKDGVGAITTKAITWQISEVTMSFTGLPIAGNPLVYNQPYAQALLALGGTGPYTWTVAPGSALPPGLAINSSTGVISGTPTTTGSLTTPITLADSASHSVTLNVNFNASSGTPATIFITGPDLGTVQQGFQANINLFPSGGTGPYTFTALSTLPPGCVLEQGPSVLNNATATNALVCTPMASGTFTFTLRADDSAGNFGVRTLTLRFAPFTLFTNTGLANGSVGVPYSQRLLTWDNGGTVSWSILAGSALPAGLSIAGDTISGIPTVAGNYTFTLSGTDASGLVVIYGFGIVISPIAIAGPDVIPQQAVYNTPFTYTFTATGGGAVKTWSAFGLPSGLGIGSTTGVVSGIPTSTGTFRVTVTVTDGSSSFTRVFTLFSRFNDPGVLNASLFTPLDVAVGQSTSIQLNPNGGLAPYNWTVAAVSSLPPGMNLYTGAAISPGQTFGLTYLQGAPSAAGDYTFDLICTDGAGTQVRRTFTLHVSAMNILGGGLKAATAGAAYAEQLSTAGATGTVTYTYAPSNTTFELKPPGITLSPSGLISGTPTSTGNYSFRATATDSAGHTFTTNYTLSVFNSFGLQVTGGGVSSFTVGLGLLAGLSTNGNSTYTWSVSAGALPPGLKLSVVGTTPIVSGAPTTAGVFNVTLRATDNANAANFADRAFTIPVAPMQNNSHGVTQLPAGRIGTAYSYTFQMAGGTGAYTFNSLPAFLSPLPPGLTLSSTGVLSGIPTQSGSFSFTYQVTDGAVLTGYFGTPTLNILGPGALNPLQGIVTSAHDGSVGVAYQNALDSSVFGGVPPYTWSVAPGSNLPPGVVILPGTNGVSSYLGGIPTTAGNYSYFLNITDAVGQTATTQFFQSISQISVSPELPLFGFVTVPYTTTLTAAGGSGPYTFALANGSSMPPGLSLSNAGVISGTPTFPGVFQVQVTVTDGASNVFNWLRIIDVNNSTLQSPAIAFDQNTVLQLNNSLIPPFNVQVSGASGAVYKAMISGIPGLALQYTIGTLPDNLAMNLAAGVPSGIYAGVLALEVPAAAFPRLAIPVVLTVTTAPVCAYALGASGYLALQSGGHFTFTVNTYPSCAWTAVSNAPWITVTSGGATGTGLFSYAVASNPSSSQRIGTITVAGQTFTVTQFGSTITCSFDVSPSTITTTAAAGTATIQIIASTNGCSWTASGLGATPSSGIGTYGSTTLTIPANTTAGPITYHATVAGTDVAIIQSGANCIASLSSASSSLPASGGGGSVNVTIPSGCSYSTVNGPSWIKVVSGGSGNGPGPNPLNYTVDPNPSTTPRNGSISIGGKVFQVSEAGIPCSVTIDTSALGSPFGPAGGGGTIAVIANGPTCSWTASSPAPWATVAPASGSGNGTVNLTVTSNASSASSRTANLTIAGQTVGITEGGTTCTFALGSSTASVPFGGGSGGVTVTSPAVCSWNSATDSTSPWLTITSSGTKGTADVLFSATPNPGSTPRTGTLTIAGQPFTVTEAAAPCNYVLSASNATVAATGTATPGSFTFSTGTAGCSASAVSYASWISPSTSTVPAGLSGSVSFTVLANPGGVNRTGTIQFAAQTYTITQTAAACAFSLNSYGALFSSTGGSNAVLGSPSALGCASPTVGTDQPSFVGLSPLSGPLNNIFSLPYSVSIFNSAVTTVRKATISFGGQVYTIKQTSW